MTSALQKKIMDTAPSHERLNDALREAGVSKTVYTYVMPETESVFDSLLDGARAEIHDMYREAWTQKQDILHEEFFAAWRRWASPVVKMAEGDYPWIYTTGGASEALRETIYAYGHAARVRNFTPVIHVFEADYEGFSAYAQAAGIAVIAHSRRRWRETLKKIGATDQVYFSQPSAIDGNVWDEYDAFMTALCAAQPEAQVIVDLTYVGCVGRAFTVDVTHKNIRAVIFSLSKPMGVYYHRIGGLLSRAEYPGLFGNKWFKNLLSIRFGTALMKKYGVFDLPRKYAAVQKQAITAVNEKLGLALQASDIYLLATGSPAAEENPLEEYLLRGKGEEARLRLCLTPTIARIVNPAIDGTVRARAHERI